MNIEYVFAKSPFAVIDSLIAVFNEETIVCAVLEKEEAIKEYEEAVQRGDTVGYAAINEDDPDVMIAKIGNFPANQTVKLRFTYIEPLSLSYSTNWEYRLFAVLTERYGSSSSGTWKAGTRSMSAARRCTRRSTRRWWSNSR